MANNAAQLRVGDPVRFRYRGAEHWGRITRRARRNIRIKGADGRRFTTGEGHGRRIRSADIRPAPLGVFVLDTHLDRSLYSDRQAADFWYRYCQAAGWSYGCERIHSLADLRYFLGRRSIREDVILLSGHGHRRDGFRLTNGERLRASTSLSLHPSNGDKLLLVSSCQIGADARLCRELLSKLRARALIGYTDAIRDDMCFIAEPYLLQLLAAGEDVARAVELVRDRMAALKTINRPGARRFPLAVYLP